MAKVKAKKTPVKKTSKKGVAKKTTALVVVAVVLVCAGIMLFALQAKDAVIPSFSKDLPAAEEEKTSTTLGPSQGCKLVGTNYVCDIKIRNPKSEPLEWSSLINGIDGSSIANGGYGTVPANGEVVVQLHVPKTFCDANPEGEGNVLILEDKKSSNQAETEFVCNPIETHEE